MTQHSRESGRHLWKTNKLAGKMHALITAFEDREGKAERHSVFTCHPHILDELVVKKIGIQVLLTFINTFVSHKTLYKKKMYSGVDSKIKTPVWMVFLMRYINHVLLYFYFFCKVKRNESGLMTGRNEE